MKITTKSVRIEDDFGIIVEVTSLNEKGHMEDIDYFFSRWRVTTAYPKPRPSEERKRQLHEAKHSNGVIQDVPTNRELRDVIYAEDFPDVFTLPIFLKAVNDAIDKTRNPKAKRRNYNSAKDILYAMVREKLVERITRGKYKRLPKPAESAEEAIERSKKGEEVVVLRQDPD